MKTVKELSNTSELPKRLERFDSFRKPAGGNSFRLLFPRCWTMRVSSLKSVLENYQSLASHLHDFSEKSNGDLGYQMQWSLETATHVYGE